MHVQSMEGEGRVTRVPEPWQLRSYALRSACIGFLQSSTLFHRVVRAAGDSHV
eukprot:CAMPEP_0171087002 /NCGR_PEP_ID=MMETSP0766_2-20121228/19892_1 /TAXON_ID=439317 /ORGANISM="Gambierdiscus australes, Strain CAWD 149" /LENGTH=52 /DNA_ID=CAMNT_0011544683 /DNA_START=113 /DNA_END=268 /DNA_ORIENTATION=-